MSIIYEALKKTQDSSPREAIPEVKSRSGQAMPNVKRPLGLAAIVILILGVSIFWFFRDGTKPQASLKITRPPPSPSAVSAANPAGIALPMHLLSLPAADKEGSNQEGLAQGNLPNLILNGIVLSGDGNIALVNNQIVRVGDAVEGAKVEEISDNQIVLTFKNQKISLRAK